MQADDRTMAVVAEWLDYYSHYGGPDDSQNQVSYERMRSRKRKRMLAFLASAVIALSGLAFVVSEQLGRDKTEWVVAKRPLDGGAVLSSDDLVIIRGSKRHAYDGDGPLIGRALALPVEENERISAEQTLLLERLEPGERVLPIQADAGLIPRSIRVSDTVDIVQKSPDPVSAAKVVARGEVRRMTACAEAARCRLDVAVPQDHYLEVAAVLPLNAVLIIVGSP